MLVRVITTIVIVIATIATLAVSISTRVADPRLLVDVSESVPVAQNTELLASVPASAPPRWWEIVGLMPGFILVVFNIVDRITWRRAVRLSLPTPELEMDQTSSPSSSPSPSTEPMAQPIWTPYQLKLIWEKAHPIAGYDPAVWRSDDEDNPIKWSDYRKVSDHGWDVDYTIPIAEGGSEDLANLRPLNQLEIVRRQQLNN